MRGRVLDNTQPPRCAGRAERPEGVESASAVLASS
jgi:hypothetical protein